MKAIVSASKLNQAFASTIKHPVGKHIVLCQICNDHSENGNDPRKAKRYFCGLPNTRILINPLKV
ncbi:unnamed protein product [Dovyalis caffra]|uniref:Uncharacterized protein n=1 Tax=Dovyalis caffra TaxID=77055 RepID=A0AAV1QY42_9ROSI|nr:unnamed protein product [Dovyalis caffra]